ncbi:MAG: TonB-dependent receptor, partial [Bacteroidetes bacterium]
MVAQTWVQGKAQDTDGNPLPGVNIMIKGSFDGATTNAEGHYAFRTSKEGDQMMVASFMGYKTLEVAVVLSSDTLTQNLLLEADSRRLHTVVFTAGTFEAGDQRKSVTLQPLDIVTTPSAAGDIYGMLTSLPGAANVGEDGRLFVRGGDGYESKTFIDGMMVRKPYSSSAPDLPSRGRFSPFLFSGTTFSTGGYSAEYGQALSSALILNTNAFPEHTQTEISMMVVGMGASQTVKKDNYSFSAGLEYTNLEPYFSIIPQSYTWNQHPTSLGATLSGHLKTSHEGIIKVFSTYSNSRSGLLYPDLTATPGSMQDIALANSNIYSQVSYLQEFNSWTLQSGVSFGYDVDSLDMKGFSVQETYYSAQARLRLSRKFSDYVHLKTGAEASYTDYSFQYREKGNDFVFDGAFSEMLPAVYAEAESRPFSRLALRTGIRHEYSSAIHHHATAWRASAAWLLNADWQASLAAGSFYQTPEVDILRYATRLKFEKANHYIANIQYEKDRRLFRAELYQKDYHNLVSFSDEYFFDPTHYENTGEGHARGVDLFFRDRKTFRNLDYWLSYSYVDAKR